MKSTVARLGVMRVATLGTSLLQSLIIVRSLSLESLGQYYLIATIAYLGNAAVFVGADAAMQRQLAKLSEDPRLNRRGISFYVFCVAFWGSTVVLISSTLYFWFVNQSFVGNLPLLCCVLSITTYLSLTTRNAILLTGHAVSTSALQFIEAASKATLIGIAALLGNPSAETLILATAGGSLCSAICAWFLLGRLTKPSTDPYQEPLRPLIAKISAIGSSGLLNWAQLQGYRPLLAALLPSVEVIGAVAFLTTLGATVGNSISTIMSQIHVPRQFTTNGETTSTYAKQLWLASISAAIIALPFAYIFLLATNKSDLSPLLYLFVAGIFIEMGNGTIGIAISHCNIRGKPIRHIPIAGTFGCLTTLAMLLYVPAAENQYLVIAAGLAIGQLVTVSIVWFFTFKPSLQHVEQ